ncbi:subtilisin-like protease SBT4.3 [Impatiens glandulifera]|uniref:subtilisin-like protease SBT4.3 n=1 Tax=Impatiens glandulifera TaxID=253017 RepID=UPI001FB19639|nr:subtilisin-like protease SBT4.3 [Impatiens glandulifera]
MANSRLSYYFLLSFVVALAIGLLCEAIDDDEERKVFIVYMGSLPEDKGYKAKSHHIRMLQALGKDKITGTMEETLVRSYTRSFNGFVARLTSREARKLENMEEVVSVFESRLYHTQTTKSWDYLGFSQDVLRNPPVESDIIIGSIDSGITPESESFSDQGLDNIPMKWKGVCEGGKNFTCNKKLIGAKSYTQESARDYSGHGTHTASTAAGREVPNTSFFGLANGTARGAVPGARIAAYKVCNLESCEGQAMLAAFDDAIADGVDIITISIGIGVPSNLSIDVISIGSFHAMEKGILTVQSGGNNGNDGLGSVTSIAPWLFTVAASSIDIKIINKLVLRNQHTLISTALNSFPTSINNISLVYGRIISSNCSESDARKCNPECVDPSLVKGKIVVCDALDDSGAMTVVTESGAAGVILSIRTNNSASFNVPLPSALLYDSDFSYVLSYLNSTRFPLARITKSEIVPLEKAPAVADFSGRGPNKILPQIFKPDITAPGIDILAAYSPFSGLSDYTDDDKRRSKFSIISGTSMACPHVAGAAAYLKSMHPLWSPSAIKSALMTTATPMNVSYNVDSELGYGAGQIDPLKALHPGLVYETFVHDYINMFCSLGSEGDKLLKIFRIKKSCPKGNLTSLKDLNYPSMVAPVDKDSAFNIQFSRIVKNVGRLPNSTYHAQITTGDSAIHVSVEPSILSFTQFRETKSFVLTVSGQWLNQDHISCSLVWSDGTYRVRSPILLYRNSIV